MVVDTWKSVAIPILHHLGEQEVLPGGAIHRIRVSELSVAINQHPVAIVPELSRLIDGGYITGTIRPATGSPGDVQLVAPKLTDKGARQIKKWSAEGGAQGTVFSRFFDTPLKKAAGIAVSVMAIVSLVFALYPQLKPKEKLGASIASIEVEQQVSFRQYKERTTADRKDITRFQGIQDAWLGDLIVVRVTLSGYKDHRYFMAPRAVDANTNKLLSLAARDNRPTLYAFGPLASPTVNEDNLTFRSWSLSPPMGTEYYYRIEIYDGTDLPEAPGGGLIFDESRAEFLDSKKSVDLTSKVDPGWR